MPKKQSTGSKTQVLAVALGGGLDKANKLLELEQWKKDVPEGSKIVRTVEVHDEHIAGFEEKTSG